MKLIDMIKCFFDKHRWMYYIGRRVCYCCKKTQVRNNINEWVDKDE